MNSYSKAMARVRECLQSADRILAVTGAGVSVASGLPTYRGVGGLYTSQDTEDGMPIERALSGSVFQRQPALTWKYIHAIERAGRGASPNGIHQGLVELEKRGHHVTVLTQNVDGLHRQAGSSRVIAIHGAVDEVRCTQCTHSGSFAEFAADQPEPRCPMCGRWLRPNVVLFGEMLRQDDVWQMHREFALGFDLVLSIGTTSVFPYIQEPIHRASQWNALTVEINPSVTEVSHLVHERFACPAEQWMEELLAGRQAQ